jgi:hypothetical protein
VTRPGSPDLLGALYSGAAFYGALAAVAVVLRLAGVL